MIMAFAFILTILMIPHFALWWNSDPGNSLMNKSTSTHMFEAMAMEIEQLLAQVGIQTVQCKSNWLTVLSLAFCCKIDCWLFACSKQIFLSDGWPWICLMVTSWSSVSMTSFFSWVVLLDLENMALLGSIFCLVCHLNHLMCIANVYITSWSS